MSTGALPNGDDSETTVTVELASVGEASALTAVGDGVTAPEAEALELGDANVAMGGNGSDRGKGVSA